MGFHNWIGCFRREWMFDVAPAFQTTRRKTMARSRKPTPMHLQSRANWRMLLTSALVMKEVASLFLVIEEVVALGISVQMR